MELFASIFTFLLGPFIYGQCQRKPNTRQLLNGFIFITIAGIVSLHIIPDSLKIGGLGAVGFLIAGLVFPNAIEKLFKRAIDRAHQLILVFAAFGLIIHAIIDGLALLPAIHGAVDIPLTENPMALGVIMHRLPIGMAIWWSARSYYGTRVAILAYAIIILATSISYYWGSAMMELATSLTLSYFQAFVAGSLIHIIAFGGSHTHDSHIESNSHHQDDSRHSSAYRLGVLMGLILLFALSDIFSYIAH